MHKILNIVNYDMNALAVRAKTYDINAEPDVKELTKRESFVDKWRLILIIIAFVGGLLFSLTFINQFTGHMFLRIFGAVIMGLAIVTERILLLGTLSIFSDKISLKLLKTADITFYNIVKNHKPTCYIKEVQDEYCTVVVTVEDNNKVDSQPILFYKKKSPDVNVLTLDVLNKTVLEPVLNG